ncbi:MAG TPA: sulfurtransferase TusA family protein [Thermoplasmata archaeon]|nr:sulfurtransferase TusA family protein [Thermoplasmata archaeon]
MHGIVNTVEGVRLQKDATLDAKGLMCPMPIVHLAKKVKEMKSGQILELLADDVGAKEDVPAWCSRTGNQLVATEEEGKILKFYIKMK